jgi:hypothetical protein
MIRNSSHISIHHINHSELWWRSLEAATLGGGGGVRKSYGSSVGIVTGWRIGVLWFDSQRRLRIFLLTTVSRTALGPTQPPIQRVAGALSLGVKLPGREADHSPPFSAEVKEWVELYLHSPGSWNMVMQEQFIIEWRTLKIYCATSHWPHSLTDRPASYCFTYFPVPTVLFPSSHTIEYPIKIDY